MRRREMPLTTAGAKKRTVPHFTRSAGFEHSVVRRQGAPLSHFEKLPIESGRRGGFQVECTTDGRVFGGNLDPFDRAAAARHQQLTAEM
jgi:hypothetical protein